MATPIYGGDGGGFTSSGNGYSFPAVTLNDATGNEVAFTLEYTTNKASSGNDTGLLIDQTDTLSPGLSHLIEAKRNTVSVFIVDNVGSGLLSTSLNTPLITTSGNSTLTLGNQSLTGATPRTAVRLADIQNNITTGQNVGVEISTRYNQASGDAANTELLVNKEVIAVGSGVQLLIDLQVDDVSKFNVDDKGLVTKSVDAGLTADVGSAQGGLPLTACINEISTVGTTGDSATLKAFPAVGSIEQTVINNGANACDVFPATGDDIGAGVNTAVSLAAGANITYVSYDATNAVAKT